LRISKWGEDKNVKPQEMQAIVRKRQKRKLVETDKRQLVFKVRDNEVERQKIERWMKRHDVADSFLYAPSPAARKTLRDRSVLFLLTQDSYTVCCRMSHDLRARLARDDDDLCPLANGFSLVSWAHVFRSTKPADTVSDPVSFKSRTTPDQRLRWAKPRSHTSISSEPPSPVCL
jgi:hypothetical protein